MPSHRIPATLGQRYILHDAIGQGGMGAVHRATDRLTGRLVALKQVQTGSSTLNFASTTGRDEFRLALANEFRVLASIRHPNIIQVLDYGFNAQREPFFTMELYDDSETILDAARGRSLDYKIGLIVQVLQALAYLHRRGIVHRDLKPGNLLVSHGSVKVLDFGLSLMPERAQGDAEDDPTVGTLAYMAPEVLAGGQATASADLYSLGVIAFELIAGVHPFESAEIGEMVSAILNAVPDLDLLDVTHELGAVIGRLLAKSPESRFASAQDVIAALRAAVPYPLPVETAEIRESFLQAAAFVGRERELAALTGALTEATHGRGSLWFINGESGAGKSRLLDELRTRALIDGITVMTGQAISEAGTPYQMWRMALGWLALLRELAPSERALIKTLVPDVPLIADSDLEALDIRSPHKAREEMLEIFTGTLKSQGVPHLLILEDLHWAGSESLALLDMLRPALKTLPLLVVASFRDDHAPRLSQRFPDVPALALTRLSEAQIQQLSTAMLGMSGQRAQVVELLKRETGGNIFYIIEIIRALAEETGQLDQIGQTTLPPTIFSGGLRRIIRHRLSQVPDTAHVPLQLAAVMGRSVDPALMQAAVPELDVSRWLMECADLGIMEVREDEWRFAHDKLREGVLEELTTGERRDLHARTARAIEAAYGQAVDKVVPLAYHWRMAHDPAREAHYTALAGRQALRSGAYHEAIDYFDRALELTPDAQAAGRVPLLHAMADAHLGMGGYSDARSLYQRSLTIAQRFHDETASAYTLLRLGDIAYAVNDFTEAQDLYQRSRSLYQRLGDLGGLARVLNNLGDLLYDAGDHDLAKTLYHQSMQFARESGTQWGMAGSARKLATGEQPDAKGLLNALDTNLDEKNLSGSTQILVQLGATREVTAAVDTLVKALEAGLAADDTGLIMTTLLYVARLLFGRQRYEQSLELLAFLIYAEEAADTLQEEAEALVYELEDVVTELAAIWERGKAHSLTSAARQAMLWLT